MSTSISSHTACYLCSVLWQVAMVAMVLHLKQVPTVLHLKREHMGVVVVHLVLVATWRRQAMVHHLVLVVVQVAVLALPPLQQPQRQW